jgi:hypothetical protein
MLPPHIQAEINTIATRFADDKVEYVGSMMRFKERADPDALAQVWTVNKLAQFEYRLQQIEEELQNLNRPIM